MNRLHTIVRPPMIVDIFQDFTSINLVCVRERCMYVMWCVICVFRIYVKLRGQPRASALIPFLCETEFYVTEVYIHQVSWPVSSQGFCFLLSPHRSTDPCKLHPVFCGELKFSCMHIEHFTQWVTWPALSQAFVFVFLYSFLRILWLCFFTSSFFRQ